MEAFTFSTAELILLSAAGVFLIIQYIYYLGIYNLDTYAEYHRPEKRTATSQRNFLPCRS